MGLGYDLLLIGSCDGHILVGLVNLVDAYGANANRVTRYLRLSGYFPYSFTLFDKAVSLDSH